MKRLIANNANVDLTEKVRKSINKKLQEIDTVQSKIPITAIYQILDDENIVLLQDDYSQLTLSEFKKSFANIDEINTYLSIAHINTGSVMNGIRYYIPINDSLLYISWTKSDRGFEVNCYLS